MTTTIKLVLASSSPYRRELLNKLGFAFDTANPDIDETPLSDEAPMQTAIRLSLQKAAALAPKFPQHLIIGSNQVADAGSLRSQGDLTSTSVPSGSAPHDGRTAEQL